MRKVSLGIAWCALLSVFALILGACIKPIGMADFLENEIVKGIIEEDKKDGIEIGVGYEPPEEVILQLRDVTNSNDLADDDFVEVKEGETVTITVTNADEFDDDIEWYYGELLLYSGDTYIVDTADAPFNGNDEEKTYQLMVKGTANNKPYDAVINIVVIE